MSQTLPVRDLTRRTLSRYGVTATVTCYSTPGTYDAVSGGVTGQVTTSYQTLVLEEGVDEVKDLGFEGEVHVNDRKFTLDGDWGNWPTNNGVTTPRLAHRDTITIGTLTFRVLAPAMATQAGSGVVGAWIVLGRVGAPETA